MGCSLSIVLDRRDGLVQRDVEVVVEVASVGGIPGERPALARLVRFDLGRRRAGDVDQRGIPGVQVARSPSELSSAPAEQLEQPSSQSGENMKWLTMS